MGYTTYDFSESLNRTEIPLDSIEHVIAAWGKSPEGYASWEGGFLIHLHQGDSSYIYLTGWCDTSGWGCRDGAEVHRFPVVPDRAQLPGPYEGTTIDNDTEWDDEPADLNRYVQGLITKWDAPA